MSLNEEKKNWNCRVFLLGKQNSLYFVRLLAAHHSARTDKMVRIFLQMLFLIGGALTARGPHRGFLDLMVEDEALEGSGFLPPIVEHHRHRILQPPPERAMPRQPLCPFGCQCGRRVVQCSDLGLSEVPADIPKDTTLLDLQGNKITEIKDDAFKGLHHLQILILVNNKIVRIHARALVPLVSLQRLHLSRNNLLEVPTSLPSSLVELRLHENKIRKVPATALSGLAHLYALEMGDNPLENKGIENGAFQDLDRLAYIRISEAHLESIPKGLPSHISELHLDGNKITTVNDGDLKGLAHLSKLGLGHNAITAVANGSLEGARNLQEVHLNDNKLTTVPRDLRNLKYTRAVFLHNNDISALDAEAFCRTNGRVKKTLYTAISLYGNPIHYWDVPPSIYRCTAGNGALQLGNLRK
uniref:Decorin n=1 Tax=Eptatretus burgeri TaxID=7764 RepID=A0A8C4X010_EPTBU